MSVGMGQCVRLVPTADSFHTDKTTIQSPLFTMPLTALTTELLRAAMESIGRMPRADMRSVAHVVADVLLDPSDPATGRDESEFFSSCMKAHNAREEMCEHNGVRPLAVLRTGPRNADERALISCLLTVHIAELIDETDGPSRVRAHLPALDLLEFDGLYAPYSALAVLLPPSRRARIEEVVSSASFEAGSERALAARHALRGHRTSNRADAASAEPNDTVEAPPPPMTVPPSRAVHAVAAEVETLPSSWWIRWLQIVSGWALLRGLLVAVARVVFSLRSPATLSLEGRTLRVVGHTEMFGRTLRTYDVRLPVDHLTEIRRESRFPLLPLALSIFAIGLGTTLGARTAIEGAGMPYFPLVALGAVVVFGGWLFDVVLRSIWPGAVGQVRLTLRTRDGQRVALGHLPEGTLDTLLDQINTLFDSPTARVAGGSVRKRG